MNRIMTALALASMFAAAPAFAKHQARKPAVSSVARADKAPEGEAKAPEGDKAKAPEGEKATKKKAKKSTKKAETTTETKTEAAPAK